jgi:hypothetical protein
VLLVSASNARADYTYNIANYSLSNPGYTVRGSITTDTDVGYLQQSDIEGFAFELDNPDGSCAETVTGSSGDVGVSGLLATPTSLSLTVFSDGGFLYMGVPTAWSPLYLFYSVNPVGTTPVGAEYCASDGNGGFLFDTFQPGITVGSPDTIGTAPVVIATAVPEPATLALLGSALLGLAGAVCLRRRAKA